ncbi:MAG: Diguanylate cyclase with beta propeller sensor [Chthonomonadaceae bacterium]|nr:Diguanylate cyclase with beta propeller sensor [Chthonomonadaceae bacterium]
MCRSADVFAPPFHYNEKIKGQVHADPKYDYFPDEIAAMIFRPLFQSNRLVPILLCLIGLLGASDRAGALDTDKSLAQCRLDVWTTKDGLPAETIHAMAQTPNGYLWFATGAGLVRFDGVTFRTFNSHNTPGLKSDNITALMMTRQGQLWIGTDSAGFGAFENQRFFPISTKIKDRNGSIAKAMLEARDGTCWIGGEKHNLLRDRSGRFTKLFSAYTSVQDFVQDRQGAVWAATKSNGLLAHYPDGSEVGLRLAQGLPTLAINCLVLDGDNSLWIGTNGAGLCRYRDGKFKTYTTRDGLSSNEIQALCLDHQGNLWIGTRVGLDRMLGNRFSTFHKIDGLHDVGVSAIFEDREGDLWVGSGAGLNRFRNTRLTPVSFPTPEGLANTSALAEGQDGSLWFGTDSGLKRLHNGVVTTYTTRDGLPSNDIVTLHMARDGALWIITPGGGITRKMGDRFTTLFPSSPWKVIGEDREGLVFADRNDYARLSDGKFVPLPHTGQSEFVFNSYLAADGTLWFTSAGGLAVVRHDQVTVLHQGLPVGTHVMSVAQSGKDCLWLGTDKGLVRYENGAMFFYGIATGLPDDNLFELLIDAHGELWVGAGRGIFSVSIRDLEGFRRGILKTVPTRLYDAADGVRSVPTRMQAVRTQERRLLFLGSKGATLIDPDRLATDFVPPPVVVERVSFDNNSIDTHSAQRLLPDKGDLEIHYAGLTFSDPERVAFRYKLEGYDKDWVEAGTRRTASYAGLSPGDYRFRVIAGNSDGIWNTTGAEFEFRVAPQFYQTAGFKMAGILMLGLCSLSVMRFSAGQAQRSSQQLEAKVSERTEHLHRSHEEIEAANRRLQTLATTDGMTGLANHRAFQERLRSELALADTKGRALTLLLLDVDHFKTYNDAFGHPAGDEVLRTLARLMRENIRGGDYAARYGGEEFAILLPNTPEEAALDVAERLRCAVAEHVFPHRHVTLSIGVARNEPRRIAPETFVALADGALYAAKNAGRNRVARAADPSPTFVEAKKEAKPVLTAPFVEEDPLMSLLQRQDRSALSGVMALLNLRDPETDGHSYRVTRFALRLAQEVIRRDIAALTSDGLRDLTLGSLLHDIGKIGMPDAVLFKPGALTEEEWEIVHAHPEEGARVLEAFSQFVCALPIVRSHHEKWDGTGYPHGLAGERIPLGARLFALADTLDAMSSDRPYRAALPYAHIRAEVDRMSGTQFDPALVRAFQEIPEADWERLRRLPPGIDFPSHSL